MNKRIKKKLLKPLNSIKKIKLNENDTIVIECNTRFIDSFYNDINTYFKSLYPKNKILVLPYGVKLKIMSK